MIDCLWPIVQLNSILLLFENFKTIYFYYFEGSNEIKQNDQRPIKVVTTFLDANLHLYFQHNRHI